MEKDILKKLEALLSSGITSEAEAVYMMSALRKLLEKQQVKEQYKYLTFHCDWTLHSKLEGRVAQEVLSQFDAANLHLKAGVDLDQLPRGLRREIDNISQMKYFKKELAAFLDANGLPNINAARADGWIHFLHLYVRVIEDCPLVISTKSTTSGIDSVTVHVELAKEPLDGHVLFKVTWTVLDRSGQSGDLFIINSFSLKPQSGS
jgi:hypothetical protein